MLMIQFLKIELEKIGIYYLGVEALQSFRKYGQQGFVNFHRSNAGAAFCHNAGKSTGTRPYFQHGVALFYIGIIGNCRQNTLITEKILAKAFGKAESVLLQQAF